ncbi:GT4 family glycosyltransferase PelF, partial [Escherichia coli]
DLWVRFFETMGRVCYDAAEEITALYEGNRLRQVIDGAPVEKTRSIPNGINLPRLAALRDKRPANVPRVMCLIGRVVPIKDVKTFIRAMLTI